MSGKLLLICVGSLMMWSVSLTGRSTRFREVSRMPLLGVSRTLSLARLHGCLETFKKRRKRRRVLMMTSDQLDVLQAAAEAATPGPWSRFRPEATECHEIVGAIGDRDNLVVWAECEPDDAEFIAAANPAVVLELIKRVREAEQDAGDLSSRLSIFLDEVTGSRLSYATYPVETMLREVDARYERLHEAELSDVSAERDAALARIARVEALHAKHENTIHTRPEFVCSHRHCVDDAGDQHAWPCPTVRALTDDLVS